MQYNPFEELERLFRRMSRQFEEATDEWEPGVESPGRIDLDVVEREDAYEVSADLPGFEKDDVDVRLSGRTLRIEAEREEREEREDEGTYLQQERRRSVSRAVTLPEPVDADAVSASYENGVLTVTVPRAEPVTEGATIEIED